MSDASNARQPEDNSELFDSIDKHLGVSPKQKRETDQTSEGAGAPNAPTPETVMSDAADRLESESDIPPEDDDLDVVDFDSETEHDTVIDEDSPSKPIGESVFSRDERMLDEIGILGYRLGDLAPVPVDSVFGDDAFIDSVDLREIGYELISRHFSKIGWLRAYRISYVWKRKGSKKGGELVLGTLSKVGPRERHYSHYDYVVEIAADHMRAMLAKHRDIEAAVFHELLHATYTGEDRETLGTRGHDVEAFVDEIEVYGLWRTSLRRAAPIFRQEAIDLEPKPTA